MNFLSDRMTLCRPVWLPVFGDHYFVSAAGQMTAPTEQEETDGTPLLISSCRRSLDSDVSNKDDRKAVGPFVHAILPELRIY